MSDLDIFKEHTLFTVKNCTVRLRKPQRYGDIIKKIPKITAAIKNYHIYFQVILSRHIVRKGQHIHKEYMTVV